MEFKKIKKVINQIYNEETKEKKQQIKNIKEFSGAGYCWDAYTMKDGSKMNFEKLTPKQHEKTLTKQKEILQNKILNKLSGEYLTKLKYVELLENTPKIKRLEISVNYTSPYATFF